MPVQIVVTADEKRINIAKFEKRTTQFSEDVINYVHN